jgi:hypothetical protein
MGFDLQTRRYEDRITRLVEQHEAKERKSQHQENILIKEVPSLANH